MQHLRNYIGDGTKFNARKEDVVGETYLGISVYRFYLKCTQCSAEFTIKTDPKNSDYIVESGATRNFEPWRAEDEVADTERWKREDEEMGDAMKSLKNRSFDSKREKEIAADVEELKSLKSRHASVSVDAMLEALHRADEKKTEKSLEEKEDENLVKLIVFRRSKDSVRRIDDDQDFEDDFNESIVKRRKTSTGFVHVHKSPSVRISIIKKPADSANKIPANDGLLSLFQEYGNDNDL